MPTDFKQQFQVWSDALEARFGAWPAWKKLIVFMPALIVFSAIIVAILGLLGAAVQGLAHH